MKNKLTIIRGIPGSGKSTYAKKNYKCLILENDMFHERGGLYRWLPSSMKGAIEWCEETCRTALGLGMDVVVANTFVDKKYVDFYKDMADEFDADFEVIRMENDFGNVHNVPEKTLSRMKSEFDDYPGEKIVINEEGDKNGND